MPVAEDGSWEFDPETLDEQENAACTGFDLTKQSYASISVGDPTDVLRDFEGDRTRLEWETPPQWATEEIAGFVDFLLGEVDDKTSKTLGKALDSIGRASIRRIGWTTAPSMPRRVSSSSSSTQKRPGHSREIGYLSFEDEEGNLNEFTGADIAGWLVFAVDRPLAELAIHRAAAADGEAKWLAKASASLDEANDALERSDLVEAIEYLGQTWKFAQRALK